MEEILIEVLELFINKLKNKRCTNDQVTSAFKAISENMEIFATADEIAEHYGKSKDAVHGIIKRRMIQKPIRNLTLYSFKAFQRIAPLSWRRKF